MGDVGPRPEGIRTRLSHLQKRVPITMLQVSLGSDAFHFSDEVVTTQL